jgi:sugar phosphate isomerase/epimerase
MGMSYLIVASLDDADRVSQDSYRAAADTLITASRAAAAAGITLGYHNHNYEFEPLDGKTGLEVMLARTAGTSVVFEMDIYWITSAGQDPLAWFEKWPGRFPLVHVKDAGPAPKYVMHDVGAGVIDWKKVFKMSKEAGIKHYFVEHDDPGDAYKSIAASYAYLKHLDF